jgi:hypothetical protein
MTHFCVLAQKPGRAMRATARTAHHASLREDDLNQVQRDSLSEAAYCRSPHPQRCAAGLRHGVDCRQDDAYEPHHDSAGARLSYAA